MQVPVAGELTTSHPFTQARCTQSFSTDDPLSAFSHGLASPALSNHEVLMQDPLDAAKITIANLLSAFDQETLYVFCPFEWESIQTTNSSRCS